MGKPGEHSEEISNGKGKVDRMALKKRGKTWHTHFFVDGIRYRQSLQTTDWRQAQSKEKELIALATQGKLNSSHQGFAKLSFLEAGEAHLSARKLELNETSQSKERQLLVKPTAFFLQKRLSRITTEDILGFREWRSDNRVGPATINMEVGVIRRILKRAKRWHLLSADIRPLKEPESIGRALTDEEKLRLLRIAGQNEEWQRAEAAMSLALTTTMRGCEIKQLQWRDLDFLSRAILVRISKTEAGQRLIPMNDAAYEILKRLRNRAKAFSGIDPEHYVFPACEHGHVDATRHQTSFRTAWRNLTRAIQCPLCGKLQKPGKACTNSKCGADIQRVKSPFAGLRFHDLRHHAITELAESQVSDQTIMAIAGHVSQKMLARYSHVRKEARRQAVAALSAKPTGNWFSASGDSGYDTRNDTKSDFADVQTPEVIEKMVGPCGLEPQTSSVSRKRSNQLSYGPVTFQEYHASAPDSISSTPCTSISCSGIHPLPNFLSASCRSFSGRPKNAFRNSCHSSLTCKISSPLASLKNTFTAPIADPNSSRKS
jgi:integrase